VSREEERSEVGVEVTELSCEVGRSVTGKRKSFCEEEREGTMPREETRLLGVWGRMASSYEGMLWREKKQYCKATVVVVE
jgi:hypothetical protein